MGSPSRSKDEDWEAGDTGKARGKRGEIFSLRPGRFSMLQYTQKIVNPSHDASELLASKNVEQVNWICCNEGHQMQRFDHSSSCAGYALQSVQW